MDIPLNAIEHRAVVLQQDTVGVPTATLQRLGLADRAGQDREVVGLGNGIGHVWSVYRALHANSGLGFGFDFEFDDGCDGAS